MRGKCMDRFAHPTWMPRFLRMTVSINRNTASTIDVGSIDGYIMYDMVQNIEIIVI